MTVMFTSGDARPYRLTRAGRTEPCTPPARLKALLRASGHPELAGASRSGPADRCTSNPLAPAGSMTGASESPRWRDAEPATSRAPSWLPPNSSVRASTRGGEGLTRACEAFLAVTRAHLRRDRVQGRHEPGEAPPSSDASPRTSTSRRRQLRSNRATERALKAMIKVAADATGGKAHDGPSGGKLGRVPSQRLHHAVAGSLRCAGCDRRRQGRRSSSSARQAGRTRRPLEPWLRL